MRISRRKTPTRLKLRAAREKRCARLYKHAALEGMYHMPTYYKYEINQVAAKYRKFYKGPYAHTDS